MTHSSILYGVSVQDDGSPYIVSTLNGRRRYLAAGAPDDDERILQLVRLANIGAVVERKNAYLKLHGVRCPQCGTLCAPDEERSDRILLDEDTRRRLLNAADALRKAWGALNGGGLNAYDPMETAQDILEDILNRSYPEEA